MLRTVNLVHRAPTPYKTKCRVLTEPPSVSRQQRAESSRSPGGPRAPAATGCESSDGASAGAATLLPARAAPPAPRPAALPAGAAGGNGTAAGAAAAPGRLPQSPRCSPLRRERAGPESPARYDLSRESETPRRPPHPPTRPAGKPLPPPGLPPPRLRLPGRAPGHPPRRETLPGSGKHTPGKRETPASPALPPGPARRGHPGGAAGPERLPCPFRHLPAGRRSRPRRAYRLGAGEGRRGAQQQPQGRAGGRDGEDEEEQRQGQQPRPRARHGPTARASGLPGCNLGAERRRSSPEEGRPRRGGAKAAAGRAGERRGGDGLGEARRGETRRRPGPQPQPQPAQHRQALGRVVRLRRAGGAPCRRSASRAGGDPPASSCCEPRVAPDGRSGLAGGSSVGRGRGRGAKPGFVRGLSSPSRVNGAVPCAHRLPVPSPVPPARSFG